MEKEPKILIIDTQPYHKMVQSRALDSYFHKFKKENLMQIFSDSRIPCKGQCERLFQIKDIDLLKRRFKKNHKVGNAYFYDDLPLEWPSNQKKVKKPKNKGPIYRFLRKFIWKKKYWNTPELEKLVSNFSPDFIFVGFSKDFFIFDIALHFSRKLNVPMILSIADDYVFYDEYRGRFLNSFYRKKYLKLVKQCFERTAFSIFESDKIKNKYIEEFKIKGHTIFISSDVEIKCSEAQNRNFCYFGNLEYGRADSLIDIAYDLFNVDPSFSLDVYSKDHTIFNKKKCPINLFVHNQIPYDEVIKKMHDCFCILIVEGFGKKNVEMTRYSLSTKVGDSLSFDKPILVYGNKDCGAIGFFIENNIGYIATKKQELKEIIEKVINKENLDELIRKQIKIRKTYFDLNIQSQKFKDLVLSEWRND